MFAAARTQQQDIHGSPRRHATAGLLAERRRPATIRRALTVTELSGALKRTVETAFGLVRVRGEISGFKRPARATAISRLKDDGACIDAVIWRGQCGALAFRPEDGIEVIATGKLTTYPGPLEVPDRHRAAWSWPARAR